jgi:hypothetical protein
MDTGELPTPYPIGAMNPGRVRRSRDSRIGAFRLEGGRGAGLRGCGDNRRVSGFELVRNMGRFLQEKVKAEFRSPKPLRSTPTGPNCAGLGESIVFVLLFQLP